MDSIVPPSIPYIGPIYGRKFTPGKLIRIQGITPGAAYRFNIQLQCGPDIAPRDDVAIQISVRLLEGYIIINSLQNGIWDEEQRGSHMPIKRAEKFEIILMCDYSHYKVAINGQHYCEFPQRIHYDGITHLAIDGDVSIMQISYESAARDGLGSSSRSGIAAISGPSAPTSLTPNEKEDDFEMIGSTSSPPGINSIPPSYGAAVHGILREPAAQSFHTTFLYPVGASYSTAAPYPSTGAVYPTSGVSYPTSGATYPKPGATYPTSGTTYPTSGVPYPTTGAAYPTSGVSYPTSGATYPTPGATYPTSGVPYPTTGVSYATSGATYPTSGAPSSAPPGIFYAPGIPPPPPGPPVPLNFFAQAKQRPGWQKCCGVFCAVVFSILLIATLIYFKIFKRF